jgi:hypothetical protein
LFSYHHPVPAFGRRRPPRGGASVGVNVGVGNADLRFFLGAYVAGTAFALAYLF